MDTAGPRLVVAYVGNFTRPWCTEVHVAASLRAEGHDVVQLQENEDPWSRLLEVVDAYDVGLVLWTRTWPADLDVVVPVLDALRVRGVPSCSYHLDRWFGLDREHQVDEQPFFRTDLVVSPDDSPRWAEHNVAHLWQPPAVYDAECQPVGKLPRRWPYDVVFVGSHPYPHPEWRPVRSKLLSTFTRAFGRRFAILPRQGQPIRNLALTALYQTVPVVLGDSCLAGETHRYWSDRVPETLGRGGVLVHPEAPGIREWYDSTELSLYPVDDPGAAVQRVRDLLDDEADREEIRYDGRVKVLGRDTYRHRMRTVLGHLADVSGPLRLSERPPAPEPPPTPRRPTGRRTAPDPGKLKQVAARQGRFRAFFDPRDIDVAGGDFVVVSEVWRRNDYRVPATGLRGQTVLDVGANVGAFSVLAAKAGAERVIAYEPEPDNRSRLEHHLKLNHVSVVEVRPQAIVGDGAVRGVVTMVGHGGGAHVLDGDVFPTGEDPATAHVEAVHISTVLDELGEVDLLKLDVEGGEYDILGSLTAHDLDTHVRQLVMEWHGPVMPHLEHLADTNDGRPFEEGWGELVALLADAGHVEMHGHPRAGGLLWWKSYR